MLTHIVLFQWKNETLSETKEKIFRQIDALTGQIVEIESLSQGEKLTSFPDAATHGFTHGAVLTFRDQTQLERYLAHPAHQQLLADCRQSAANILEFNYLS